MTAQRSAPPSSNSTTRNESRQRGVQENVGVFSGVTASVTGAEHSDGDESPNLGPDVLDDVTDRAGQFAEARGADSIGTADVLFAVFDVYGKRFDRALYMRGTSREELVERLTAAAAQLR